MKPLKYAKCSNIYLSVCLSVCLRFSYTQGAKKHNNKIKRIKHYSRSKEKNKSKNYDNYNL